MQVLLLYITSGKSSMTHWLIISHLVHIKRSKKKCAELAEYCGRLLEKRGKKQTLSCVDKAEKQKS